MASADGTLKESTPVDTHDSCAARNRYSQIGAQVYYNEDPHFYNTNPLELIVKSHSKNNYVGSATIVVLTLDGKNLKGCYIGGRLFIIELDSGFIVIRCYNEKPVVIYQFAEQ